MLVHVYTYIHLSAALEATQSELFGLKNKYDSDAVAKYVLYNIRGWG